MAGGEELPVLLLLGDRTSVVEGGGVLCSVDVTWLSDGGVVAWLAPGGPSSGLEGDLMPTEAMTFGAPVPPAISVKVRVRRIERAEKPVRHSGWKTNNKYRGCKVGGENEISRKHGLSHGSANVLNKLSVR